jgi:hypothetical protein
MEGKASAITSGYNVAQVWERFAPLSLEQQNVLDLLSQPCSRWPFQEDASTSPSSVGTSSLLHERGNKDDLGSRGGGAATREPSASQGKAASVAGDFDDATFKNSEEFYKWFSGVEAVYLSETESKFREYATSLKEHSQNLAGILSQIDDALRQYDNLKLQQLSVRSKTQSVQSTCERLSREREQLQEFANSVKSKLDFFDDLQRIGNQINLQQSGNAEDYIESLGKIDDCIAYLASNTQYLDSASYLTKYRTLQHKALASVRHFVCTAFTKATEEVQSAQFRPTNNGGPTQQAAASSGMETALLYVKFKAAVPDLQKVIGAIQLRLNRQDYSRLMHDIQSFYSERRIEILSESVEEHLVTYQNSNELPMLIRLGCAYLIQVTQMEYQLFRYFFPSSDSEALKQVITPLCTILYEIVRPDFIAMYDISSLCGIIGILKTEIIEEQFGGKAEALAAMRPVIEDILGDAQERLVYSMQNYIRDEISYYTPTKEDLEVETTDDSVGEGKEEEEEGKEKTEITAASSSRSNKNDLSNLYVPVQNTLLCLSKTYGCLGSKTFGGLAQEVIQYCTDSCILASQEIAKSKGLLNSQLFLIKNLLALREQLSLFNVEFDAQETELDFSHMRDHLRRILRGESSLFALGSSNAVFQLIGTVRPRISKMHFDSKRELEKRLKTCCESYIMAVTKLSVEPMLSFITKVTTTKVAVTKKALKDHAFATPSKLIEIVTTVNSALEDALPKTIGKMKKYLDSPNTHLVLFKPIKSNIAEAHGQIAHILESEYDVETIEMVPLMPPPKLMGILDSLS